MDKLIKQLSKSGGDDTALDLEIWLAVHPDKENLWALSGMTAQREQFTEKDLFAAVRRHPSDYGFDALDHNYTGRLDSAVELVPENHGWTINSDGTARVWNADKAFHGLHTSKDRSPATALCVAALKALSTEDTLTTAL